jgi:hypothetical protein
MGKNKQQAATEARVKKTTSEVQPQPVAEQPKPEVKATAAIPATATPAPTQPSKQMQTIEKLKEGWTAKGVNLDKLTVKDDGKFKLVIVDQGWPTVQIGPTGGITVTELKSYAKAFDAAMDGLALYAKQQAREQKKAATATPAQPKAAEQTAVTA